MWKVLCDEVVENEMGRKDEEAMSVPFQICELNQVSIMTMVTHSDLFFPCMFSNKSSTIISFAVSSDL